MLFLLHLTFFAIMRSVGDRDVSSVIPVIISNTAKSKLSPLVDSCRGTQNADRQRVYLLERSKRINFFLHECTFPAN